MSDYDPDVFTIVLMYSLSTQTDVCALRCDACDHPNGPRTVRAWNGRVTPADLDRIAREHWRKAHEG